MAKDTLKKINFFGDDAPATPLPVDVDGVYRGPYVSDPVNIEELVPGITEVKNTRQAIAMIEKAIEDRPVEYLVIWDPYDKKVVYAAKGDKNSVGFPVEGAEKYGNCIVTHNHPREGKDIMGGTFSFADCSAMLHGFSKIRAVSGSIPDRGTYELNMGSASRQDLSNFLHQIRDLTEKIDGALDSVVARHRKALEDRLAAEGKTLRQGKPTKAEYAACVNEQLNSIDRFLCKAAITNNIKYSFTPSEEEPEAKKRLVDRLRGWFENYRAAKATDADPEMLDDIARRASRTIAAQVAKNPNASKDTLMFLAATGLAGTVAKNPSADEELLTLLYDNNDESLAIDIASNESIPPALAERIFNDYWIDGELEDIGALYKLANNTATPNKILRRLKNDPELEEAAKATLNRKKELKDSGESAV